MADLKVVSKKYNDADVLEVQGDVLPVKFSVSNIQSMTDEELNSLKVGDVVQKKTGNQKHCYVVTYKEEKHGICLSYVACGYMETISYDYTAGHWVFNSKDVQETQEKLVSGTSIKTVNSQSLLGSGNIVVGGDTHGYRITLNITYKSDGEGTNFRYINGNGQIVEVMIPFDNTVPQYVFENVVAFETLDDSAFGVDSVEGAYNSGGTVYGSINNEDVYTFASFPLTNIVFNASMGWD